MKNLLLVQGRTGKLYYKETATNTKAEAIWMLQQAIDHLKNPELNHAPKLTNNCDVYEVIQSLCFPGNN